MPRATLGVDWLGTGTAHACGVLGAQSAHT